MRRIEFIAPVEAMRGNLSGKQTLEYPLNDNPAFDAPVGKHYATNYQPRFIGAKRASDGLKYFAVKTKSAIHKTAKSTLAMAALGAGGAIIGAILADKTSALYGALMAAYDASDKKKTFRKFLSDEVISGLRAKINMFMWTYFSDGQFEVVMLNNPFQSGGVGTYDVTISNDVLVKFWSVLANNPITFSVDGQTGIAHKNDTFTMISKGSYNVLGLGVANVVIDGDPVNNSVIKNYGDDTIRAVVDDSGANVLGSTILGGSFMEFITTPAELAE